MLCYFIDNNKDLYNSKNINECIIYPLGYMIHELTVESSIYNRV